MITSPGGAARTAPEPNPVEMLHSETKTIITLATALLGVSVTFASDFVGDEALARVVLAIGWLLLLTAIAVSIFAAGKTIERAKTGRKNRAGTLLSCAFWSLFAGALASAVAAGIGWLSESDTLSVTDAMQISKDAVAGLSGATTDKLATDRFERFGDITTVDVMDTVSGMTFEVWFDRDGHVARVIPTP